MMAGVLWVAVGGALGSVCRHLVNLAGGRLLGVDSFPWNTLTVNVLGSFAMGIVVTWVASRTAEAGDLRLFLATGVLGGFTTFSAFSLDVLTLLERREPILALGYSGASVLLSLLGTAAGLALARAAWS